MAFNLPGIEGFIRTAERDLQAMTGLAGQTATPGELMSALLKREQRSVDIVARYGGRALMILETSPEREARARGAHEDAHLRQRFDQLSQWHATATGMGPALLELAG